MTIESEDAPASTAIKQAWWSKHVLHPEDEATRVLCKALPKTPGQRILDFNCGSGITGIYALLKRQASSVTFVDASWDAIEETTANVTSHVSRHRFLRTQVAYFVGRYQNLREDFVNSHDLIVFNRPMLAMANPASDFQTIREFLRWHSSSPQSRPRTLLAISLLPGKNSLATALREADVSATLVSEKRLSLPESATPWAESLSPEEQVERSLELVQAGWNSTWTATVIVLDIRPLGSAIRHTD